jgi:ketol-acid reductoisomerase
MAEIYYDKDVSLDVLEGKTIGVVGYGSQGHAQAQNLRDSGLNVIVAEVQGTDNYKLAKEHSFEPMSADELASKADIIAILVPDEIQAKIYKESIEPNLKEGNALLFSHGFNIRFKQIIPPVFVDVIMVAPKGPGHLVRSEYEKGGGVPNLVAVENDASGNAFQLALAYSKGIGGTKGGALKTTFSEETETDLFGEQVVLCGGVSALVKKGFEVLIEAGYQPEIAYFECMHELKLIVDLFYQGGLSYMRYSVSNTAEYGDFTRGERIISEETKKEMKKILSEVKDGSFAKEWIAESANGKPNLKKFEERDKNHPLEVIGRELRGMMDWIDDKVV